MFIPQGESSIQVQIQASQPPMNSPLQAEAAGLLLAAATSTLLQVNKECCFMFTMSEGSHPQSCSPDTKQFSLTCIWMY